MQQECTVLGGTVYTMITIISVDASPDIVIINVTVTSSHPSRLLRRIEKERFKFCQIQAQIKLVWIRINTDHVLINRGKLLGVKAEHVTVHSHFTLLKRYNAI